MKIVLEESDLIEIVKKHFSHVNITEAEFNKTKVRLDITTEASDLGKFHSKSAPQTPRSTESNSEPVPEKPATKNIMGAGKSERNRRIANIG